MATGKRGKFITFEGIDGCGKTTQMHLLAGRLRKAGREVVETVEPGGTEIGRMIRKIVLDAGSTSLVPRAELLLYFASRAQNVAEVIRPGLESGAVVLCDRFTDSTLAYQGAGRGIDAETILALDRIACEELTPDLTLLIDIDVETSLRRAQRRNRTAASSETRLDDESAAFHERVRGEYHAMSARQPERFAVLNGELKIKAVEQKIWEAVAAHV